MAKLHDPNKPAHEIITVNDDGSALRNDGKTLGAANDNVYYRLATVAGEHKDRRNSFQGNIPLNRRYWNAWACAGEWSTDKTGILQPSALLQNIAQRIDVNIYDLRPLSGGEIKAVLKRLGDMELPAHDAIVNFMGLHFEQMFVFEKHVVLSGTNFNGSQFSDFVNFNMAQFVNSLTSFEWVKFNGNVDLSRAEFNGDVNFRKTHFDYIADFRSVQFSGYSGFKNTQFGSWVNFNSAKFKAKTDFTNATFKTYVPEFHAAELYDHTLFSVGEGDGKYWPPEKGEVLIEGQDPIRVMPATRQKKAYNRLRLFMNETLQVDDEMFFHRREMVCKKQIEKPPMPFIYGLYQVLSDYGYSITRPLGGLCATWLVGWVFILFGLWLNKDVQTASPIIKAMGISFSNVFSFLGFGRSYLTDYHGTITPWLSFIGGTQTILGVIFLFLFGLGMRSRFRLR
ncbi:MAG: hypothetical protein COB84_10000 [Rhodobacteraceae bacterium]|nr:MAG: hypothetical protein COB84_10000 [Paracoccaceae bacterium]